MLIFTIDAIVGGAAVFLQFSLVHTASSLTTALVLASGRALAGFAVLCLHSPGPAWGNVLGMCLLPFCASAHAWYMGQRERMREVLARERATPGDAEVGGGAAGGGAKPLLSSAGSRTSESSPLKGSSAPSTAADGCVVM